MRNSEITPNKVTVAGTCTCENYVQCCLITEEVMTTVSARDLNTHLSRVQKYLHHEGSPSNFQ
jgi:hypothetical protein